MINPPSHITRDRTGRLLFLIPLIVLLTSCRFPFLPRGAEEVAPASPTPRVAEQVTQQSTNTPTSVPPTPVPMNTPMSEPADTATPIPADTATPIPTETPTSEPTLASASEATPVPVETPSVTINTREPIAQPPSCSILPMSRFAGIWSTYASQLGCPLNRGEGSQGATQAFQNGRMIWRQSTDSHYAMVVDGQWWSFADEYEDGMPEPTGYQPPPEYLTPVRGFGIVWRNYLGGPDGSLGWALEQEHSVPIQVQDFEKGIVIELENHLFILGDYGILWFWVS